MSAHIRVFSVIAGILAICIVLPLAGRNQEKSPSAPPANAPKPVAERPGAAEMLRLQFYLGEWDYTETYPKSGFAPEGGKNTGVYTSKLGPGGMSLINTFHSQGPIGDFEGLLVMTWDAKEKAYKAYIFGNDFPGAVVQTGQFEDGALVYRSEFAAGDKVYKLRNVARLVAPGKLVSDEYSATADAPELLLVHVEATKRK